MRYRLEERFVHNSDGINLKDGSTFSLRHLLRLQAIRSFVNEKNGKSIIAKISNEFFFNAGGTVAHTFDQNRIYIGEEFSLSKKTSIEVGYLNLLQLSGVEYFLRDIGRITLYQGFQLFAAKTSLS